MLKDVFLVLSFDILVSDWVTHFSINPATKGLSIDCSVLMLNEAHDPSHLNATLEGQLAVSFNFPSRARITEWANLSEACNDNNSVQIDHALSMTAKGL